MARPEEGHSIPGERARHGGPAGLEAVLERLVHHVAELVTVFDHGGTVLWVNDALPRVLGWEPQAWVGRHAVELAHPDDIPLGMELLSSAKATGPGVKEPVVYRLAHADGSWVDLEVISSNVALPDGQLVLVTSARPAGAARPPTAIFDEAAQRVSAMFDRALIGMAQVALDGRILRANEQMAALVGAEHGPALLHQPFAGLLPPDMQDLLAGPAGLFTGEGGQHAQVRMHRVDGREDPSTWARLAAALVHDHRGAPLYYAVQAVDISDLVHVHSELLAIQAELLHHSHHDALTGLANRLQLADWMERPARAGDSVLYVDLDGFKAVNDTYGHAAGDALLVAVAARLRAQVRRDDLVVRVGGDEFVIVCPGASRSDAEELARRVVEAIGRPLHAAQGDLHVRASIGVATGDDRATFEGLIARADLALYRAKAAGAGPIAVHAEGGQPTTGGGGGTGA